MRRSDQDLRYYAPQRERRSKKRTSPYQWTCIVLGFGLGMIGLWLYVCWFLTLDSP